MSAKMSHFEFAFRHLKTSQNLTFKSLYTCAGKMTFAEVFRQKRDVLYTCAGERRKKQRKNNVK